MTRQVLLLPTEAVLPIYLFAGIINSRDLQNNINFSVQNLCIICYK